MDTYVADLDRMDIDSLDLSAQDLSVLSASVQYQTSRLLTMPDHFVLPLESLASGTARTFLHMAEMGSI